MMVSRGGVEAGGGGEKVRWRTSQSSLSTSQRDTTAREPPSLVSYYQLENIFLKIHQCLLSSRNTECCL